MIDPSWAKLEFKKNLVTPGESLPNLVGQPVVAVDIETMPDQKSREIDGAGLNPWHADLLGISVAVPGEAWYLPLRHRSPSDADKNLNSAQVYHWLTQITRSAKFIVNQNLKFDLKHLIVNGALQPGDYAGARLLDTMLASQLIDEREPTHSLKPITAKYLNMPADEEAAKDAYLIGQKKARQDWSVVPVDVMAPYGCSDVERALRLAAWQAPKLATEEVEAVYAMECEMLRVLVESELRGVLVDVDRLKKDRRDTLAEAIELEAELEKLIGVSVNPGSIEELADAVQHKLGLPILGRTKPSGRHPYGLPRFDDEVLLRYIREYPDHRRVFWNIRKARRLHHIRNSFIEAYLECEIDHAIHSNFNQLGARTGRMSSDSPNLQQVPDEEEFTLEMNEGQVETWRAPGARQYFVPRPGYALLLFDASQIEYRFFAHYTNSPRLIQAYASDATMDMHQWATDLMNGILGTSLKRSLMKSGNFGIVYGMGQDKLVRFMSDNDAAVDEAAARRVLEAYHREVPELAGLQDRVSRALMQRGYVKTILGRRRRAAKRWGWGKGQGKEDRGLKPYQALNAICQGSSADLLKYQAIRGHEVAKRFDGSLLVTIHDELMFEVPGEAALEAARALRPVLETFLDDAGQPRMRVPIYVDAQIAHARWSEAEDLDLAEEKAQ